MAGVIVIGTWCVGGMAGFAVGGIALGSRYLFGVPGFTKAANWIAGGSTTVGVLTIGSTNAKTDGDKLLNIAGAGGLITFGVACGLLSLGGPWVIRGIRAIGSRVGRNIQMQHPTSPPSTVVPPVLHYKPPPPAPPTLQ